MTEIERERDLEREKTSTKRGRENIDQVRPPLLSIIVYTHALSYAHTHTHMHVERLVTNHP